MPTQLKDGVMEVKVDELVTSLDAVTKYLEAT